MAIAVRGSGWAPFAFDADFDTIVRRAFGPQRRAAGFGPAADVTRDGADLLVTLELPGIDGSDVNVEVSGRTLVISGERHEERTDRQHLVREIRSGSFRREFALPRNVNAEQVTADYDRGLLTVRVPGAVPAPAEPTRVQVRGLPAADTPAVEPASDGS